MNGRNRHILMDTTGLLLTVDVHPADVQDRDGTQLLLGALFPRLAMRWADAGDLGRCAAWITATLGWAVEIVRKPRKRVRWPQDSEPPPMPTGFQVLGPQAPVGGGAHLRLAGAAPAPEQG